MASDSHRHTWHMGSFWSKQDKRRSRHGFKRLGSWNLGELGKTTWNWRRHHSPCLGSGMEEVLHSSCTLGRASILLWLQQGQVSKNPWSWMPWGWQEVLAALCNQDQCQGWSSSPLLKALQHLPRSTPGPSAREQPMGAPAAPLASQAIRSLTGKWLKTGLRANLLWLLVSSQGAKTGWLCGKMETLWGHLKENM